MTDLVERLREEPAKQQRGLEVMDEAADEIERLRKRVEAAVETLCLWAETEDGDTRNRLYAVAEKLEGKDD